MLISIVVVEAASPGGVVNAVAIDRPPSRTSRRRDADYVQEGSQRDRAQKCDYGRKCKRDKFKTSVKVRMSARQDIQYW